MPRSDVLKYLEARAKIGKVSNGREDISLTVNENKYFGRDLENDYHLVFVTDIDEADRSVNERIESAARAIEEVIQEKRVAYVRKHYDKIIAPFVHSKLKIALVGEGGVGKTTTLHLLMGRRPPEQYIPTVALGMEVIDNIHFATYSLVLWDFAGQERFRRLWKLYFQGADIIFLLTDSTLRNILVSKDIFSMIRRDAPNVPVVVIANKQDMPNALDPSIIERLIGAETHPLVAVDIAYRDDILKILLDTAARHVNVQVPDVPPEELLQFIDDDASS